MECIDTLIGDILPPAELMKIRLRAEAEGAALSLRGDGEAEAARAVGVARAEVYRLGREAMGAESYAALQIASVLGENKVKLVPDVSVAGNGASNGLVELLLARLAAGPHQLR